MLFVSTGNGLDSAGFGGVAAGFWLASGGAFWLAGACAESRAAAIRQPAATSPTGKPLFISLVLTCSKTNPRLVQKSGPIQGYDAVHTANSASKESIAHPHGSDHPLLRRLRRRLLH